MGRRLSSFLPPRSPLVKILSGKTKSASKVKRGALKQQKKENDEAKISA